MQRVAQFVARSLCGADIHAQLRSMAAAARVAASCSAVRAMHVARRHARPLTVRAQLERIAIQFLFDAADDDSKTGLKDAERAAHKKLRALMG